MDCLLNHPMCTKPWRRNICPPISVRHRNYNFTRSLSGSKGQVVECLHAQPVKTWILLTGKQAGFVPTSDRLSLVVEVPSRATMAPCESWAGSEGCSAGVPRSVRSCGRRSRQQGARHSSGATSVQFAFKYRWDLLPVYKILYRWMCLWMSR